MRPSALIACCVLGLGTGAAAQVATGAYVGDGAAEQRVLLPFAPAALLIKAAVQPYPAILWTATMPAGMAKDLDSRK